MDRETMMRQKNKLSPVRPETGLQVQATVLHVDITPYF